MKTTPHSWLRPVWMAALGGVLNISAFGAAPPACTSSVDANEPLTLATAIDSALCRNTRTASSWVSIKLQQTQSDAARAAFLPTVNASLTTQSNTNSVPGSAGSSRVNGYSSYLGLNWRIFDFGERAARREAANLLLSAAVNTHDDTVRRQVSDTIQSYFSALQANATVDARRQAVEMAERTRATARSREDRGAASRSDTLQADSALARSRMSLQRAKAELDKSTAMLAYIIGAPAGSALRLPDLHVGHSDVELLGLSRLLDIARAHHPAILAARLQRDAGQANIAAARAAGRPTLDLTAANYRNGYPNQSVQASRSSNWSVGATLTIPIFDGHVRRHNIQQAQAQAEKAALQAQDTENQVLTELVKEYSDLAAAQENIAATQQWLVAAQASMASATLRYERGAADMLELISAQNTLNEALDARAQCEYQWNSARLKLMSDTGSMDRDAIAAFDAPPPAH